MRLNIPIAYFFALLFFIIFVVASCNKTDGEASLSKKTKPAVSGNYMNMIPTKIPKLLSPDLLASSLQEYNGTFNLEGTEFYFTTNTPSKGIICYTKIGKDNKWIAPRVAAFSGTYSEYDPIFSPDGSKLYFSSERPLLEKESNTQSNIWYVYKEGDKWSKPIYVDLKEYGNYYSSITNTGTIYFNRWDNGDMFKAIASENGYEVEKLSDKLNTSNGEGDPFVSPEEDYIIYRGYNNSLGNGDLYISYRIDNEWTAPENLGEPINSEYHEMCPYVTTDGKFFIFSSSRLLQKYESEKGSEIDSLRLKHQTPDNGELNIYYISSDFIEKGKEKFQKK